MNFTRKYILGRKHLSHLSFILLLISKWFLMDIFCKKQYIPGNGLVTLLLTEPLLNCHPYISMKVEKVEPSSKFRHRQSEKYFMKLLSYANFVIYTASFASWACALVAFVGSIVLVFCHVVSSLPFIWRSGTRRLNLRVPHLQMNCREIIPQGPGEQFQ